jgi:hypothetical protein
VSLPSFQLDCGTSGNAVPTLLLKCGTAGKDVPTLLRACPPPVNPDLPEGCYSASPCLDCESGAEKRTPKEWNLTLSISALGCYQIDPGYYVTLGATAATSTLDQSGSCTWGPSPFRSRILWSPTKDCFSPDCDPLYCLDGYTKINAVPVLTRISATQFRLTIYFENGDFYVSTLDAEDTITIDNCRSAFSGTTNLTGPGPTYPVVGTLSYSLSVRC